ncbi:MAG: DHA2 family efflux MFS transporter permease subunit [Nocardioidaceae bacterium]
MTDLLLDSATAGRPKVSTVSASSSSASRAALAAAVLGFFIVTFDAVVLNVSLPSIRNDLGGGIAGLQWVVDGYTLMFAALLLAAGAFSDRVGARRAFSIGVAGFVAASAACGLAPGLGALVAARFVQGSAAAVLVPASMALISQAYSNPFQRARAIGMWAMGGAAASSSAPVLGGLLTVASWRLIFLINIPIGILAIALATRAAPSRRLDVPFDRFGFVAAFLAMGGLTFGAIDAGEHGFTSPLVLAAFAVAGLSFGVFVAGQRRAPNPIVPLELFRSRNMSVAVVVGFAFVVGYYGLPFVMSLYLQQLYGLSAFQTGLVFVPMMLIGGVLTPFSARIAERFGARRVVATGLVLMAAGLALLAVVTSTAAPLTVAALMLPVGLAGPLVMPPITSVLLNSVPDTLAGTASGVFNTSRQLGGALAIAVFGALVAQPAGFIHGLRLSLTIAAIVALAAAVASRLLTTSTTTHRSHTSRRCRSAIATVPQLRSAP